MNIRVKTPDGKFTLCFHVVASECVQLIERQVRRKSWASRISRLPPHKIWRSWCWRNVRNARVSTGTDSCRVGDPPGGGPLAVCWCRPRSPWPLNSWPFDWSSTSFRYWAARPLPATSLRHTFPHCPEAVTGHTRWNSTGAVQVHIGFPPPAWPHSRVPLREVDQRPLYWPTSSAATTDEDLGHMVLSQAQAMVPCIQAYRDRTAFRRNSPLLDHTMIASLQR